MGSVADIAQAVVLAAAALAAAIYIARQLRRAFRATRAFVARLELMHDTIAAELLPNGGTSVKDRIRSIDRRLQVVEAAVMPAQRDDGSGQDVVEE